MKILLAYSDKQVGYGHDPYVDELCNKVVDWAEESSSISKINIDEPTTILDEEFDIILLADSLDWYLDQRLKIRGRPWICLVAFSFDTLIPFLTIPTADSGLHAIICNSTVLVSKVSIMTPCMFHWKPVPYETGGVRSSMIGTVLPNVADRDFCLLKWVYEHMREASQEENFIIAIPESEKTALPEVFKDVRIVTYKPGEDCIAHERLKYFIPAPRITDYRVGVIPPEIIRAVTYGCKPILLQHPAIKTLREFVDPVADSFFRYKEMVKQATSGELEVVSSLPKEMTPSTEDLTKLVINMYERWKTNAASRRKGV